MTPKESPDKFLVNACKRLGADTSIAQSFMVWARKKKLNDSIKKQ